MGKVTTKDTRGNQRHVPLYKDITQQPGTFRPVTKAPKKNKTNTADEDDENSEVVFDSTTSRAILKLAKEQQEEIEEEENRLRGPLKPRFQQSFADSDDEEDDVEYEEMSEGEQEYYEDDDVEEINEDELAMFEKYLNPTPAFGGINLADKIMEKIHEKEQLKLQKEQGETIERPKDSVLLPPRVIEAYEKVGMSLSAWRHGKLPKLFKVLPSIKNWEDLMFVTNPEAWSPQIVYEATKLFVSNLTASKAERFVNLVLLPRFRQDIEESDDHKLNYHIYRSLKKALYKPSAFFKGFLFPLVFDDCSVREAMIVGSILTKCSIPVQHSSVALSTLLQEEFNPATTVFIRILIDKKYALPYQTIDDCVNYFMRFRVITDQTKSDIIIDEDTAYELSEEKKLKQAPQMPLVWHKAFLAFAQRYKNDITEDQRDFLMEVLRQRGHKSIGSEIRRELQAGQERIETIGQEPSKEDDIMSYF